MTATRSAARPSYSQHEPSRSPTRTPSRASASSGSSISASASTTPRSAAGSVSMTLPVSTAPVIMEKEEVLMSPKNTHAADTQQQMPAKHGPNSTHSERPRTRWMLILWVAVTAWLLRGAFLNYEQIGRESGMIAANATTTELWQSFMDTHPTSMPLILACGLACYGAAPSACICCTIMAERALFVLEVPPPSLTTDVAILENDAAVLQNATCSNPTCNPPELAIHA